MHTRNCPNCHKLIEYKYRTGWYKAKKLNSLCKSCSAKTYRKSKYNIKTKSLDGKLLYVRECPGCNKELVNINYRKYWDAVKYNKMCKSCASTNRYNLSELSNCEIIDGIRKFYRSCPNCKNKIYYKVPEHARRFMNSLCKNCAPLSQKYVYPNFNETACKIIDDYGDLNGYKFQHALNGGEFLVPNTRYYVDGYDIVQNVVIEVDESHHKYQIEHDALRQQEIIKQLKCKFIRLVFDEHKNNYIITRSTRSIRTTEQ